MEFDHLDRGPSQMSVVRGKDPDGCTATVSVYGAKREPHDSVSPFPNQANRCGHAERHRIVSTLDGEAGLIGPGDWVGFGRELAQHSAKVARADCPQVDGCFAGACIVEARFGDR